MKKILIANRGEIARRIIRACHDQGYEAVAVYDAQDADALHVREADEAVFLPGNSLAETYLNAAAIVALAQETQAWGVHPGYGFLSENSFFAQQVLAAGLVWIGPDPDTIALMGDKGRAKEFMQEHGIPVIPGYQGNDQSLAQLQAQATALGFPVMIKAAHGGGGRGIRVVTAAAAFADAVASAQREAEASFGSRELILEKQVLPARHIEVQILADQHGQAVAIGERDCSLQRRNQKIIEEGPAPELPEKLRQQLYDYAEQACKACGYVGAGTVEYLVSPDGAAYFLEMNTRVQVEHPVTEMVTGIDIVATQIAVAAGAPLAFTRESCAQNGHAIEVRLYSEDPAAGFCPQTGQIVGLQLPEATYIRIDHDLESGQEIRSDLDPMMAKLIVWGQDRPQAVRRLRRALKDCKVLGVIHNGGYLAAICQQEWFHHVDFHTKTIDGWAYQPLAPAAGVPLTAVMMELQQAAPQLGSLRGLRNSLAHRSPFRFRLRGSEDECHGYVSQQRQDPHHFQVVQEGPEPQSWDVVCRRYEGGRGVIVVGGVAHDVYAAPSAGEWCLAWGDAVLVVQDLLHAYAGNDAAGSEGLLTAPMAGAITKIFASEAAEVAPGDTLVILEAMKMEHEIKAPFAGKVHAVHVQAGQQVKLNQPMVEISQ